MDECWGHYIKWNYPVTKRQIVLWFHLPEISVISFIEKESRRWRGGGKEKLLFKGYRVSVSQDEKSEVFTALSQMMVMATYYECI